MYSAPRFLPAGDSAISVEFGDDISPTTNAAVRGLLTAIEDNPIGGIVDLVPSYRSLLALYNPMAIGLDDLQSQLSERIHTSAASEVQPRRVEIPTLYGGEAGPDIEYVAQHNGISVGEVIEIHSGAEYLVYMLGFSPGFPYLGGMSERIATPRLDTPRTAIPAGSVGIAERQTGVYPSTTPGGWRLIGKTPLRFFDAERDPPGLLEPGDVIRFIPIDADRFAELERAGEG